MMKTRQGTKRAALNEPENKQKSSGKKKPRPGSASTSKYFDNVNLQKDDNPPENEQFLNTLDTAESTVDKCEEVSKIKNESDSDSSSSDEFMKAPFSLDELGRFESLRKDLVKNENENEPCCLDSSNLSSDSGDEKETNKPQYYDFSQIIKSQQLLIDTLTDREKEKAFEQNQLSIPHNSKKRAVKKSISKKRLNKDLTQSDSEELGVSELLYIAEGTNFKTNHNDCRLEVSSGNEDTNLEEKYSVPKEGVQVTIELPNLKQKRKSKDFDIEAAMKRRINLIRKENQIFMHKVHVLCWIAHCLYLNRTINNDDLLGVALSLIPSKHCYPPKHADLSYLEKLVDWFVTKIIVDKDHKQALNCSNLPLLDILEVEINTKVAFSLRDLALIFVSMIRSLGISARLVVSLRPVPLRPPVNDLCQVNNKPAENNSNSCSKNTKTGSGTKKKALSNEDKNKSLAVSKRHSDKMCHSQYFDKPIKLAIKINKQKDVRRNDAINQKDSKIQSPYFSSSDELPLNKLISQKPSSEVIPKESKKKHSAKNKSPKPQNTRNVSLKKSTVELKQSLTHSKNCSSTIEKTTSLKSSCEGSSNSDKSTTVKSDSKSKIGQNQLKTPTNDKPIKELMKKETRSGRTSTKISLEPFFDSSEEELEPLEIVPKQTIKSASKPKSFDSTKKKAVTNRKSKCSDINHDVDFELPKPSTSKKKSLDRRVLSSDEESCISKKIGNDFWVEVFLEAEEKWISVDLKKKKVHCIKQLYVSIKIVSIQILKLR